MKIKLLLALLLFASTAEARTYQIDITMSHGPKEVTRQNVIAMASFARAKFRAIGVSIRIGRVSYTSLINPQYSLTNYVNGVHWWQKKLPARTNIIRHVITPPFFVNGVPYLAGVAVGICCPRWKYAIAVSNAEILNHKGENRFWQSAIALTHEQGHIFGGRHTVSHSIMNIGALSFPDVYTLLFAPESITQIFSCLRD